MRRTPGQRREAPSCSWRRLGTPCDGTCGRVRARFAAGFIQRQRWSAAMPRHRSARLETGACAAGATAILTIVEVEYQTASATLLPPVAIYAAATEAVEERWPQAVLARGTGAQGRPLRRMGRQRLREAMLEVDRLSEEVSLRSGPCRRCRPRLRTAPPTAPRLSRSAPSRAYALVYAIGHSQRSGGCSGINRLRTRRSMERGSATPRVLRTGAFEHRMTGEQR